MDLEIVIPPPCKCERRAPEPPALLWAFCTRCGWQLAPSEARRDEAPDGTGWACADRAACARRINEGQGGTPR